MRISAAVAAGRPYDFDDEAEMSIKLQLPALTELRPRIKVIGVGGAGGNAINNMIAAGLSGVDYIAANTDAQALAASSAERRIQLGINLTEGLGAGSRPEIGLAAAEEAIEEIRTELRGAHMVFVAAGMGGGTGTGAAAVIARCARELDILTVGIVTKPFQFEGSRRMRVAEAGIAELKSTVDTLIVIPNQNLFRVASEKTTFADAFVLADQVLYSGIACIVDLIMKDGLINLDLADVRTVLKDMGAAVMGTGEASGEGRAVRAAEEAISNPLIEDLTLSGAKGLLLSIIGDRNLTLYEVEAAASRIRKEVDADANIIVGAAFDEAMGDRVRVAIVASGLPVARDGVRPVPRAEVPRVEPAGRGAVPVATNPMTATPPPALPTDAAVSDASGFRFEDLNPAASRPGQRRPQAAAAPESRGRELWQAPGGVTIEESAPVGGMPNQAPPVPKAGSSARPAGPAFTPAPPHDMRRDLRRMPGIEEFPPHVQREHAAKAAGKDAGSDERPSQEPPRGGLLSRLIANGFVRRTDVPAPTITNHNNATGPTTIGRAPESYPQSAAATPGVRHKTQQ